MIPHPSGGAAVTDEQVIAWLRERADNCARIYKLKDTAAVKAGWKEDENYFRAAIDAIQSRRADPVREELEQAPPQTVPHPSPASSAWRPIATATKVEANILLFAGGFAYIGYWSRRQAGWVESMTDELFAARAQPTHWTPLLPDPEAESAATHEMGASEAEGDQASPTSDHPRTGSPKESA